MPTLSQSLLAYMVGNYWLHALKYKTRGKLLVREIYWIAGTITLAKYFQLLQLAKSNSGELQDITKPKQLLKQCIS